MADQESFVQANELFIDEDFENAVQSYGEAIAVNPNVSSYYLGRAACNLKLQKYTDVVTDSDHALKLKPGNASAHLRKGTALFYLNEFHSARSAFEEAKNLGNKKCDLWLRKCNAEIRLEGGPSTQSVVSSATTPCITTAAPQPEAVPPAPLSSKVRENWFQSKDKVQITLFAKNLEKKDVDVTVEEQQVTAEVVMPDGSHYSHRWVLYARVLASEVQINVTKYKVEINLKKVEPEDWKGLEVTADLPPNVVKRENILIQSEKVTPYSSTKNIDWNQFEAKVKKQEVEEKSKGQDTLQELFQQIYANGDPEIQRAMIKSYQTSGGTVLSTNWKEVKDKDYEQEGIQAPKGQEVCKWSDL